MARTETLQDLEGLIAKAKQKQQTPKKESVE